MLGRTNGPYPTGLEDVLECLGNHFVKKIYKMTADGKILEVVFGDHTQSVPVSPLSFRVFVPESAVE